MEHENRMLTEVVHIS